MKNNHSKIHSNFKKKLCIAIYFIANIKISHFSGNITSQPQIYNNTSNSQNRNPQNAPWQGQLQTNNQTQANQPIIGANNAPLIGNNQNITGSNYTWTLQTQIDSLNQQADKNINWQKRKILKQKMNLIYSADIINKIDDSKLVIEKFSKKVDDFNKLYQDCLNEITKKIESELRISMQPKDIKSFAQNLFNSLNNIKKSDFYNHNNDFTEKVDQNDYTCKNIQAMINHGIHSLMTLENAINTINQSIIDLNKIINVVEDYENTAWNAYQKIDELISEEDAHYNNDVINNCLLNIENINNYLRGDFLAYVNDSITNMDAGVDNIYSLYEKIINSLKEQKQIIIEFQQECNQFKIIEEQKKHQLIQEQKEQEDLKKKLEEQKKRDELLRREKSKTILDKAFIFVSKAFNSFFETISNFFNQNTQIKKIFPFFQKKNESGNQTLKTSDNNTIVNKNLNNYVAPQNGFIQEKNFTLATDKNLKIQHMNQIDELNNNQNNTGLHDINQSTIKDVFHNQKPIEYPTEQIIDGASSYPIDIIPEMAILNNEEIEDEKTILPFGYENNLQDNENHDIINPIEEEINQNDNNFRYVPMEINQNDNNNEYNNLLPNLSNDINNNFTPNIIERSGMANTSQSSYQNNIQSYNGPTQINQNTLETKKEAEEQNQKKETKKGTFKKNRKNKSTKLNKMKNKKI